MSEELNAFPLGADLPEVLKDNFLRAEMTPQSLQLAAFLVENDRLEKNDLLLECGLRIANEWDLYACTLALRNGAYPGIYVTNTGKSLVATIIDLFTSPEIPLGEDTLAWRLLIVLVLSGLDVNKAAFLREDSPTIKEYWTQKLSLPMPTSTGAVRARDRFYILHLVGKERELPERALTESEARFCIKARCLRPEANLSEITNRIESDSILAVLALNFHNEMALEIYLRNGGLPSYGLTNRLCGLAAAKTLAGSLWEKVLVEAVARGATLDEHQYQICKKKNSLAKQVKAAYEVPYWKKFFGVGVKDPQREGNSARDSFGVGVKDPRTRTQAEYIPERIDDCLVALEGSDYDLSLAAMRESLAKYVRANAKEKRRLLGEEVFMPVYYVDYTYEGERRRIESPDYHRLEKLPHYTALPAYAKEKVAQKVQGRIHLLRTHQLSATQPKTRESIIEGVVRNDSVGDEETESKIAFYYSLFERAPELTEVLEEIYEMEMTEEHRRATIAHVMTDKHLRGVAVR